LREWNEAADASSDEAAHYRYRDNFDSVARAALDASAPVWREYRQGLLPRTVFLAQMRNVLVDTTYLFPHMSHKAPLAGYAPFVFMSVVGILREELLGHAPQSSGATAGPYRQPDVVASESVDDASITTGQYKQLSTEDRLALALTVARLMVLVEQSSFDRDQPISVTEQDTKAIAGARTAAIKKRLAEIGALQFVGGTIGFIGGLYLGPFLAFMSLVLLNNAPSPALMLSAGVATGIASGIMAPRLFITHRARTTFDKNLASGRERWAQNIERRRRIGQSILTRVNGVPEVLARELVDLIVNGSENPEAPEVLAHYLCDKALKPAVVTRVANPDAEDAAAVDEVAEAEAAPTPAVRRNTR
jgi:hypothetical protein